MNGRQAKKLRRQARRLVEEEELTMLSRTRLVRAWWYRLARILPMPRRGLAWLRDRGGERLEVARPGASR